MMVGWKVRCVVRGASRDDLDQWLAHHAEGKFEIFSEHKADVTIQFELMEDRIRLREAFDVVRMSFRE